MIIYANEKGIRVTIADNARQMTFGTKDATVLVSNISALEIVPEGRTDTGLEMVVLTTQTRREFAFHYTDIITFNGLPVVSNQDLYERAVDALGLGLLDSNNDGTIDIL